MSFQDNILDTSKLRLEGNFESQVNQLLLMVRLTRSEVENLQDLIKDVEKALSVPWPGSRAHPFGSIVTGLGIRTSDIDCYISLPHWQNFQNKLVYKAKAFLERQPYVFTELLAIPMAKVPILKFYHIPTQCHCDINFSSLAGVQNSKLLAHLLHVDPRALPLAVLIKYWSKVHNLTGTNLIPNYALTLLVVFFLQYLKILPAVRSLQQTVREYMVDDWNTAFDQKSFNSKTENTLSLYQLVGGFFEFYSNFDFENQVVSTYLGCTVQKDRFKQFDNVPQEYALYKHNLNNRVCRELRLNTKMCVQDPFEHSRNCSVAVHQKLFDIFLKYLRRSAQMFYQEESAKYLKAILTKVQCKADEIEIRNSQNRYRHQQPNKVMKHRPMFQRRVPKNIKRNALHMLYEQIRGGRK